MKKILLSLLLIPFVVGGIWGFKRYKKNLESIIPYPFVFQEDVYENITADAPIIIIGDSMADRLASFKKRLAQKISINLSKPIKIVSLATKGENIHRTVKKIKSLKTPPLIVIYMGNMDQAFEYTFYGGHLKSINKNFDFLKDDRIHTAILLFPILSRFIYHPIKYVVLGPNIEQDENAYEDQEFQQRTALNYTLYQSGVKELFKTIKKKNALIIPLTTPINLKEPPKKSCYGSYTGDGKKQLKNLLNLLRIKKYKEAYNLGKELVLTNPYNSKINYIYSRILHKLNRFKEAQKYGEMARIYDCANNKGNPVYNSILVKEAKEARFEYLDFHQLLMDESQTNYVFLDETYPQDFYLEKVIDALASKIKRRLRL